MVGEKNKVRILIQFARQEGESIPIQVKALRKGGFGFAVEAKHYLEIEQDGDVQIVKGKRDDVDRKLIFVLIVIGNEIGEDKFYICEQGFIQDTIFKNHKAYLEKHNGVRPKNPKSTHCSYLESDLLEHQDNWDLIKNAIKQNK